MENVSNNLLAVLLVCAMFISILGTTVAIDRLELKVRTDRAGTGNIAGEVNICLTTSPVLVPIGDQSMTQGDSFHYDVNTSTSPSAGVSFEYTDNATFFVINSTTGIINFNATNSIVGQYSVTIMVAESVCAVNDIEIVNFTIYNVNDAPTLDQIPDFNVTEDSIFRMTVNASDPDEVTPEGEVLTFGDNTSLFEIGAYTGLISFQPVEGEEGNYSILIYVFDDGNPQYIDWQTVKVNVFPKNDPPWVEAISAKTGVVNEPFFLAVQATDEENETITYSDNSSIFNISPTTGEINFTPVLGDVGNYSIQVNASDPWNSMSRTFSLTITMYNRAPNIISWSPDENNTETAREIDENTTSVWYYIPFAVDFDVNATDPDGTAISYIWSQDNVTQSGNTDSNYSALFDTSGTYVVSVRATDGLLNDTHKWIITALVEQTGTVVVPEPPPSGGGGSSRLCYENWRCTEWSVCPQSGIQTRSCIDLNECGTESKKPEENRSCVYTPYPSCFDGVKNCHGGKCEILKDCGGPCDPCPTCNDGIRNQGEEGVDCGGPCRPCPDKCIQALTLGLDTKTGECRAFPSPCDIPKGWRVVDECPPIQPVYLFLYIFILALAAVSAALIWLNRKSIKGWLRWPFSKKKKKRDDGDMSKEERLGKEALERIEGIGARGQSAIKEIEKKLEEDD